MGVLSHNAYTQVLNFISRTIYSEEHFIEKYVEKINHEEMFRVQSCAEEESGTNSTDIS